MGTVRRLPPGTLSVTVLFPDLLLHPPSQARCSLASSPKGRAKGRALPARLFPHWGNNVGALRRQCTIEHLQMKFGGAEGKSVGTRRRSRPWLPLWGSWHGVAVTERVPASNQRTFFIYATAPALSGSLFARQLSQRESHGAGVARPVVSPLGKQRRRIAPTMAPSNIIRQNWTVQW